MKYFLTLEEFTFLEKRSNPELSPDFFFLNEDARKVRELDYSKHKDSPNVKNLLSNYIFFKLGFLAREFNTDFKSGMQQGGSGGIFDKKMTFAEELMDSCSRNITAKYEKEFKLRIVDQKTSEELKAFKEKAFNLILDLDNLKKVKEIYSTSQLDEYKSNLTKIISVWLANPDFQGINDMSFEARCHASNNYLNGLSGKFIAIRLDEEGKKHFLEFEPIEGEEEMENHYWVNLETDYSSEESVNMGHCGSDPGTQLLSLRTGTGQSRVTATYKPEFQAMYQCKGPKNTKPTPEYHRFIVALLEQDTYPIMKCMKGSYAPERDFNVNDLDDVTRKRLLHAKPDLLKPDFLYEMIDKNQLDKFKEFMIENKFAYFNEDIASYIIKQNKLDFINFVIESRDAVDKSTEKFIKKNINVGFDRVQDINLIDLNLVNLLDKINILPKVKTLDLCNNKNLTSLPAEIGKMTNLQWLDLSGNENLTSLPTEIGQLTNLQILNLSWCKKLTSLPAELGQLTNLQTLNLSGNKNLTSLPIEIGQLTNLQELKLSGSGITRLPIEIENLQPKLKIRARLRIRDRN